MSELDEAKVEQRGSFFQVEAERGRPGGPRGITTVRLVHPGHAVQLYVGRVAQHWRVTSWPEGPAVIDHERYETYEAALEAAKTVLTVEDAARRLAGGGYKVETMTGRISSSANPQNLPWEKP